MSSSNEKKPVFKEVDYQIKLFSRFFYNNDFAEDIIFDLDQSLFQQSAFSRICVLIKNYYNKYESIPNISNIKQIAMEDSISDTEKEVICKFLEKMNGYKKSVESGVIKNDYDYIEQTFYSFIVNQKLSKLNDQLKESLSFGDMVKVNKIIEELLEAKEIGFKNDYGIDIRQDFKNAIKNPVKDRIPTGIDFIDKLTGGLPKGDLGLIMASAGTGKSSILLYISEYLFSQGKNVLHIIFDENNVEDTQRKVMAKWSGIPATKFKDNEDKVLEATSKKFEEIDGKLIIKRFISEGVTVPKIRNFILKYQKRYGLKFDMVTIDYMDELESHKDRIGNEWEGQQHVAKALKSLASELNIPIWSAIQTKKDTGDKNLKFLDKSHAGGSVAKLKKSQLIIGVMYENLEQQNRQRANFSIAKCNFAKGGNVWYDCELDNELLKISEGNLTTDVAFDYDEDELEKKQIQAEQKKLNDLGIKQKVVVKSEDDEINAIVNSL